MTRLGRMHARKKTRARKDAIVVSRDDCLHGSREGVHLIRSGPVAKNVFSCYAMLLKHFRFRKNKIVLLQTG